ncbi:hypothetical protein D3C84_954660 [compost metagenome]
MQVNESWLPASLRVAVCNAHHTRFLQRQDVSKVLREVLQKRELVRARIAENRVDALASQEFVCGAVYRSHDFYLLPNGESHDKIET